MDKVLPYLALISVFFIAANWELYACPGHGDQLSDPVCVFHVHHLHFTGKEVYGP